MNPFLALFSRHRTLVVGGLSLICAVLATAILFSQFARKLREMEERRQEEAMVPIVVASRAIPVGARIEADAIRVVEFPQSSVPAGHFTRTADVAGLFARTAITTDEPLVSAKVISSGQGGLSVLIPEGRRAMTVEVDEVTGLENFIVPGGRVDVFVIFGDEDVTEGEAQVELLLQGVLVLAVESSVDITPEERAEEDDRRTVRRRTRTVTLAVTPGEAARLALAAYQGRLQLTLRNYADSVRMSMQAVRTGDIRTTTGAESGTGTVGTLATKPHVEQPRHVVEVVRGKERTEEAFY